MLEDDEVCEEVVKKKIGRPFIVFSKEKLLVIESLAESGCTKKFIAKKVGVSYDALKDNAEANQAWIDGKEVAKCQVLKTNYKLAKRASPTTWNDRKHYLACNCGETENIVIRNETVEECSAKLDLSKLSSEELDILLELMEKASPDKDDAIYD